MNILTSKNWIVDINSLYPENEKKSQKGLLYFTTVQCTHTLFSVLKAITKRNVMDALFVTDTFISPSLFLVLFIISSILCREQFKHIFVFFYG